MSLKLPKCFILTNGKVNVGHQDMFREEVLRNFDILRKTALMNMSKFGKVTITELHHRCFPNSFTNFLSIAREQLLKDLRLTYRLGESLQNLRGDKIFCHSCKSRLISQIRAPLCEILSILRQRFKNQSPEILEYSVFSNAYN